MNTKKREAAIARTTLRLRKWQGVVHLETPNDIFLCACQESVITVYELAPWFQMLPLHKVTCLWCMQGRSRCP
jgi:hypothetical protein